MPQSLSNVLIHIIFSTKDRAPFLNDALRPELHRYMAGVAEQHFCQYIAANSVADHLHLLVGLSRTITIADLVKEMKTSTSKWIHRRPGGPAAFAWQRGYGAFSISPAHKDAVIQYIKNQAEHHKRVSFQDEFRRLLNLYGMDYDERYVWD